MSKIIRKDFLKHLESRLKMGWYENRELNHESFSDLMQVDVCIFVTDISGSLVFSGVVWAGGREELFF